MTRTIRLHAYATAAIGAFALFCVYDAPPLNDASLFLGILLGLACTPSVLVLLFFTARKRLWWDPCIILGLLGGAGGASIYPGLALAGGSKMGAGQYTLRAINDMLAQYFGNLLPCLLLTPFLYFRQSLALLAVLWGGRWLYTRSSKKVIPTKRLLAVWAVIMFIAGLVESIPSFYQALMSYAIEGP